MKIIITLLFALSTSAQLLVTGPAKLSGPSTFSIGIPVLPKVFVNSCSGGTASSVASVSCSSTMNVTTGNLLVVACGALIGTTITVSDTGSANTFTGLTTYTRGDSAAIEKFFYAKNTVASAADTITCNFSPNSGFSYTLAAQYSGASITAPADVDVGAGGLTNISTFVTPPFTTTAANEVIMVVAPYNASVSTISSAGACTIRATDPQGESAMEECIVSSIQVGATESLTSLNPTAQWVISAASFK